MTKAELKKRLRIGNGTARRCSRQLPSLSPKRRHNGSHVLPGCALIMPLSLITISHTGPSTPKPGKLPLCAKFHIDAAIKIKANRNLKSRFRLAPRRGKVHQHGRICTHVANVP